MTYPPVIVPILTGCAVQFIKFLLFAVKHKRIEIKYFFDPGHMPSAHTAFLVSLTSTVAYYDGVFSTTFAISFVLLYVVLYDALRIRVNIGDNGKIINKLVRELAEIKKEDYPVLKERVGHKPLEVLVGGILGLVFTVFLIRLM